MEEKRLARSTGGRAPDVIEPSGCATASSCATAADLFFFFDFDFGVVSLMTSGAVIGPGSGTEITGSGVGSGDGGSSFGSDIELYSNRSSTTSSVRQSINSIAF